VQIGLGIASIATIDNRRRIAVADDHFPESGAGLVSGTRVTFGPTASNPLPALLVLVLDDP